MDAPQPQTPAIPAATLIVVRDRSDGQPPDFLMVERAATMAFAAGAMVFPGGRTDSADVALAEEIGLAGGAGIVAAIRETIEETAIPVGLSPLPSPGMALAIQRDLLADVPLRDLLERHGLRLDSSALHEFARWLPTFHVTRRFDTHFFVAAAPPGDWQPVVGEHENRSAEWIGAAEVLRRNAAGEAMVIFPTRCNLERLTGHASFAEVVDDARRHPVETISPWVEEQDGVRYLTIPDYLGYPVTRHPLDGQTRG